MCEICERLASSVKDSLQRSQNAISVGLLTLARAEWLGERYPRAFQAPTTVRGIVAYLESVIAMPDRPSLEVILDLLGITELEETAGRLLDLSEHIARLLLARKVGSALRHFEGLEPGSPDTAILREEVVALAVEMSRIVIAAQLVNLTRWCAQELRSPSGYQLERSGFTSGAATAGMLRGNAEQLFAQMSRMLAAYRFSDAAAPGAFSMRSADEIDLRFPLQVVDSRMLERARIEAFALSRQHGCNLTAHLDAVVRQAMRDAPLIHRALQESWKPRDAKMVIANIDRPNIITQLYLGVEQAVSWCTERPQGSHVVNAVISAMAGSDWSFADRKPGRPEADGAFALFSALRFSLIRDDECLPDELRTVVDAAGRSHRVKMLAKAEHLRGSRIEFAEMWDAFERQRRRTVGCRRQKTPIDSAHRREATQLRKMKARPAPVEAAITMLGHELRRTLER